jgi:hypothetical protein
MPDPRRQPTELSCSAGSDAARSAGGTYQGHTTRMLTALAAVLLLAAVFVQGAVANGGKTGGSNDQEVIRILARIAAHQTHGWSGDVLPIRKLEADLARDRRIVVSCGTVSRLGLRAARRAGHSARLVGSFTRRRLNGFDDGHVMLEVRLHVGWTVFDLDNNRRARAGVGISELVRDPRWQVIARDKPYEGAEVGAAPHTRYNRAAFADLGTWYRRILGVPTIRARGSNWFHDARERDRGLSLGFRWASGSLWKKLSN